MFASVLNDFVDDILFARVVVADELNLNAVSLG
jgi:hypothetical protein